jgi:hypothetical protein
MVATSGLQPSRRGRGEAKGEGGLWRSTRGSCFTATDSKVSLSRRCS